MYVSDGYIYGKEPVLPLKITKIQLLNQQMMLLTFSNEETRLFDAAVLTGPVFEPLKDRTIFQNASLERGVVTWMNGEIDCAPEFMYENSKEYSSVVFQT